MNTNLLTVAAALTDEALLARMKTLSAQSRHVTVEVVAHMVEVARRGLHRAEGPGRLFGYLTQVLRFSDAAAWNRIQAARAVRRFPHVLDLLAEGSVNLTTIRLLGPHLTKENHRAVLAEAAGKSTTEIKKIAARLAPKPDVPAAIRKLPPLPAAAPQREHLGAAYRAPAASAPGASTPEAFHPVRQEPESRRPVVEPLSPARYRLQLTMDEAMHDDLTCIQDLARREIPNGDAAEIVRRALHLLRKELERKAFSATARPSRSAGTNPESRDIDADVQRAVWRRDGGQCAFVGREGLRCTERSYLEFHHLKPFALGGGKTVDEISLRCRAHNVYEAERFFGASVVVRETAVRYGGAICFETNHERPSAVRPQPAVSRYHPS